MRGDDDELTKGTPSAPETSRWGPGPGHAPTFAAHKLRQLAASGLGEAGAMQLMVTRMMRINGTEDPRSRPTPHVVVLEDITSGLGLEAGDDQRIQTIVQDTTIRSTAKTQTQHMMHARGRLLSIMRGSMQHVEPDKRDEVLRRAVAWWKRTEQTDYGRTPSVRYRGADTTRKSMTPVLPKTKLLGARGPKLVILEKGQARGGKYYRRVPKSGGGWRYYYTKAAYERAHGGDAHTHGPEVKATRKKGLEAKAREVLGKLLSRFLSSGWHVEKVATSEDPATTEMESYVGPHAAQQLVKKGVQLVRASVDTSPSPATTTRMSPEREVTALKGMMARATAIRTEYAALKQDLKEFSAAETDNLGEAGERAYAAYLTASSAANRAHRNYEKYRRENPEHFGDKGVPQSEESYAYVAEHHGETLIAIREARAAFRAVTTAAAPPGESGTPGGSPAEQGQLGFGFGSAEAPKPKPRKTKPSRPKPSQTGFDFTGVEAKPSGDSVVAAPAEPDPAPTPEPEPPKPPPAPTKPRANWETFGESVDKMSDEAQRRLWQTTSKDGETFEDWKAGLRRPKPKKPPAAKKPSAPAPKGTPRAEAEAETKRMVDESEYVNDRSSAVEQRGEDVLGSARHKALEWKSMREALEQKDAGEMFTRKFLEKREPLDLIGGVQSGEVNAIKALFLHYSMRKFPPKPDMIGLDTGLRGRTNMRYEIAYAGNKPFRRKLGSDTGLADYGRRGFKVEAASETVPMAEHVKRQRASYYEAYQHAKSVIEKHSTDPNVELREVRGAIHQELRGWLNARKATHSGRDAGWEAMRKIYNAIGGSGKTSPLRQAAAFVQTLKKTYPEKEDQVAHADQHALLVLEGKSLNKAFDAVQKRGTRDVDLGKLYNTSVMERKGPPSDYQTPEQGLDLLDKTAGGKYEMRGVQWGKSLTDDERRHHLKSLVDSWADLTDILGLPPEMASFNGKLAIAVGARGKGGAMAHYEGATKTINLTRANGAGALAHEWGHFFDNIVGEVREGGKRHSFAFEESTGRGGLGRRATTPPSGPVVTEMRGLQQSPAYIAFSDKLRSSVDSMVRNGEMSEGKADYWVSDREVFARLFERHVQRKLQRAGRENTYLTGLSDTGVSMGLWPNDGETDTMAPHFDKIFEAFAKSPLLKKALDLIREPYRGLVAPKLVVRR